MFSPTPFDIPGAVPHSHPAAGLSPAGLAPQPLAEEDRREVLDFLAERPLHTVFMAGLIRDNGVVSPSNRGTFHACRDRAGRLGGVALIGHHTLVEARSEEAMIAFARFAQHCSLTHLIRGEQEKVELFWRHYAEGVREPRRVCRELLLEQRLPSATHQAVPGLRPAAPADIENVMSVNGAMAFAESGVNPLHSDAEGFRLRTLRRIEQGRVWLWAEDR